MEGNYLILSLLVYEMFFKPQQLLHVQCNMHT